MIVVVDRYQCEELEPVEVIVKHEVRAKDASFPAGLGAERDWISDTRSRS